jgi:hypothetical protein
MVLEARRATDEPDPPGAANHPQVPGGIPSAEAVRPDFRTRIRAFLDGAVGSLATHGRRERALAFVAIFLAAFAVRSLYAVDLGGSMYSHRQPGSRMSNWYDGAALSILKGEGILFPAQRPEPSDTALLARPPGYPVFLAVVYRILGRSSFTVLLAQNLLLSLTPALLFLLAERLFSWRVGLLAGSLAAISPHLAYTSNFILADAPSALPVLGAALLLLPAPFREMDAGRLSILRCGLAGALIGLGTWLRPNLLLLGPFLGLSLLLLLRPVPAAAARGAVLALASWLVIAPITIRNYALYGELVPVSINGGLPLWRGIADAGGQAYGARHSDKGVMWEEAVYYGDPRYGEWWQTPDGIKRDRDRYRRSLAFIRSHPGAFAGAVARRVARMFDFQAEVALVAPEGTTALTATPAPQEGDEPGGIHPGLSDAACLAPGRALAWLRKPLRLAQGASVLLLLPLLLIGVAAVVVIDLRTAAFLLSVPLYYLGLQSLFALEWRMVAPMHHWFFVFAAVSWVALGAAAWQVVGRGGRNP